MEELVVARLLMGVLGRDDAQVAREVTEAEEFLREVDDVVVQYERVRPRDVERDSGHGASQVCHCSAWAPPSSAISATGGEVAMHASCAATSWSGGTRLRLRCGSRRVDAGGQLQVKSTRAVPKARYTPKGTADLRSARCAAMSPRPTTAAKMLA